jgi:hypothetical protein
VREQPAHDEIDAANRDVVVAAGFHRLGPNRKNAGNQDLAHDRNEVLVKMTNIVGSAFHGMTLGCAPVHVLARSCSPTMAASARGSFPDLFPMPAFLARAFHGAP